MKLIECYIEGFGKLKNFSYTFKDGLNVINEENGFGKTTLSVFIKSMLFGLEDTKKKGLFENDRRRYASWDGGKMGGTLTFSNGDKTYRIERTFKPKASDDTFALYDIESGRLSSDFTKNLGEELFGIDADGFERSVFLSERNLSVKNDNDKISAKISNLVGVDGDVGGIDDAVDALEDRRKYYYKKGGAGRIADTKAEIAKAEAEIASIMRDGQALTEKKKELAKIVSAIDAKKAELEEARAYEKMKAQRELIISKKVSLSDAEAELATTDRFFEKAMPTEAEISECEAAIYESALFEKRVASDKISIENADSVKAELALAEAALKDAKEAQAPKEAPPKRTPVLLLLSPLPILIGLALGVAVALPCLLIALLSIPLAILGIKEVRKINREAAKPQYKEESAAEKFIKSYNRRYSPEDALAVTLEIRAEIAARLKALSDKERELKADSERLDAARKKRDDFLALFPTEGKEPISEIRSMLAKKNALTARIAELKNDLARLGDNSVNTESGEPKDMRAVEEDLHRLMDEHSHKSRECTALAESYARLDEENEEKNELLERLDAETERLKIIMLAKEHLQKAKESLTARYLGKTREAFGKYSAMLTGDDTSLYTMDTSFALMRSEGGESKPSDAYSLGTRELYSLIMRLALIDSLYTDENPFIIFDDPFAHFDDNNLKKATELIKKIAEEKQIIYFTCAKSRTV